MALQCTVHTAIGAVFATLAPARSPTAAGAAPPALSRVIHDGSLSGVQLRCAQRAVSRNSSRALTPRAPSGQRRGHVALVQQVGSSGLFPRVVTARRCCQLCTLLRLRHRETSRAWAPRTGSPSVPSAPAVAFRLAATLRLGSMLEGVPFP